MLVGKDSASADWVGAHAAAEQALEAAAEPGCAVALCAPHVASVGLMAHGALVDLSFHGFAASVSLPP